MLTRHYRYRYIGGGSGGSANGLQVATRAGGGGGGPVAPPPPAQVQRHVAYYRHVLTLDQLAGRCAAITGGRQPSTAGKRFKKLASVMLGILVQFHSNANTTLQIQHI